jgi:His/Glu/Gln/Arg/opine family amino acid ABC transporter permease subunit
VARGYFFDVGFIERSLPIFWQGLVVTLEVSAYAMTAAVVAGLVVAFGRMSRRAWLRAPATAYVEFLRNTPVLIQMFALYFGLAVLGLRLSPMVAGVLALAAQNTAYLAEIYRAGIESVSRRQLEAALALGMRRWRAMRLVIVPIALTRLVAPIGNQLVVIIKDTSLVSSISVYELTMQGKRLAEQSAATYEVFATIAVFYLVLTSAVSLALRLWERRVRFAF